jgi:adenosyl cobinamide kinase/adenosyl cobinamide phosphate guanylyltransferase
MAYTFITGGASSGKSKFALELLSSRKDVTFIATGVNTDAEMELRIAAHQRERPATWETIEEPLDLISAVGHMDERHNGLIIDCLTMWISNLLYIDQCDSSEIIVRAEDLAFLLEYLDKKILVVSNELGMGIIPASKESREYRRLAGEVNQVFARSSIEAYLVVSSIGVKIK